MPFRILHSVVAVILTLLMVSAGYAQPEPAPVDDPDKLGQTGLQFLTVQVNPRGAALGGARVAEKQGASSAMFYNPASMAAMGPTVDAAFANNDFIAGIGYNQASIAYQPGTGRLGTFGLHLVSVDYGTIRENIRFDNDKGYKELGTVSPTALAVGLGYGYSITDRVQVGGNAKYVQQNLGGTVMSYTDEMAERSSNQVSTAAFDFGVIYETGFRGLTFGMNVRNFAGELTYQRESFEPPLTFEVGLSQDLIQFTGLSTDIHSLQLSVTGAHPRSFREQLRVGGEYMFMNVLSLRAGYIYPKDEESVNLGAGLHHEFGGIGLGVDYSYADFGRFGTVNRFGFNVSL